MVEVYKFGGASVKDAKAIEDLGTLLATYPKDQSLLIVISAMGKTTNLLENLVNHFYTDLAKAHANLEEAKEFHFNIISSLFPNPSHPIYDKISNIFVEIEWMFEDGALDDFDYTYDQIVSVGELLSTTIISEYLNQIGLKNKWVDARNYIVTDNQYRNARVNWEKTESLIQSNLPNELSQSWVLTQGFIGSTSENFTTTLGREGSDYSAAIFAACLGAKQVTIWKDVPGVLNADPKWFDQTELIPDLSYLDAIELSYYGATVIHPKTIQPLKSKGIHLFVRSFKDHQQTGTRIGHTQTPHDLPAFIFKVNQVLIEIMPKDFSFIVEDNLSTIFQAFHQHQIKINMMHNSAVHFAVGVDQDEQKINSLLNSLRPNFNIALQSGLELITIRYYDQATIDRVLIGKEVILELRDKDTFQLLVKDQRPT